MTILDRPAQFQWDADSAPHKADNCRCTVEAQIAGYYKDIHIAPDDMRRAMQGGDDRGGGTNPREGVAGLEHYGVPAQTGWKSPASLKAMLNKGYPVDIVVNYGRIPQDTRYRVDFGFNGLHSVLAVAAETNGIWVRDPDHWAERPDKTFWPDSVWMPAFLSLNSSLGIAVWPTALKSVQPKPVDPIPYVHLIECIDDVNVRDAANVQGNKVSTRAKGAQFNSTKLRKFGGSYTVNGVTRTDWLGYEYNGQTVWIARAFTKVVK